MIDSFSFGTIQIDGQTYNSDLKVFSDKSIDSSWWRREGHILHRSDIEDLIGEEPDVIIVGTGSFGQMKLTEELKSLFTTKRIEVIAEPTNEAITIYNFYTQSDQKVAACFHLTC